MMGLGMVTQVLLILEELVALLALEGVVVPMPLLVTLPEDKIYRYSRQIDR